MTLSERGRGTAGRIALWLGAAIVVAAIMFFPFFGAGMCADSSDPGESYCRSWQQSMVGIETSIWLWLGATVALGALAWWLARLSGSRSESS